MIYFSEGNADDIISPGRISALLDAMLTELGNLDRVLILPPDYTRYLSFAGEITCMLYEKLKGSSHIEVMPATGTHTPMTEAELQSMFPSIPPEIIRTHDWQNDIERLGTIPAKLTAELTDGLVEWPVHCEVNKLLVEGEWDQIISVGQLLPHELIGIANHNKNILVGAGGKDIIGKSHIIGALYGTEKMMGRVASPVRNVLNYMSQNFIGQFPISYIMTVRGPDQDGREVTRAIFAGDDEECYLQGARLCQQVNISLMDKPRKKVVAFLDPEKYKSLWVGNKAMLRTRMCIADGGELIILCAGLSSFGENSFSDTFIRKYGYRSTEELLRITRESGELEDYMLPLSQMIISDTENRFSITYAARDSFRADLESVHLQWASYEEMIQRYNPEHLHDGDNIMPDGEEIFYVSRPAQGLWAEINRFRQYGENE